MGNKKEEKELIIYTGGTWDLFHIGHLNLFKRSKELGDKLIVAVSSDELVKSYKDPPAITYENRFKIVECCKYVDQVVKQDKLFDIEQFKELGADFFIVGDDWKNRTDNPGLNWLKENNKIIFLPYTGGISSSQIKQKLMTVGPVEIEKDVLRLGSKKMIYNRTIEFSSFMQKINQNLKYFFQTNNPVYTFASSGTGAMEAAISNTMNKGDNVLVISRGKFGDLWGEIAESYHLNTRLIKLEGEEQIAPNRLENLLTKDIKGVFVNANETSIGIKTDIPAIGKIVKKSNAIFVVDAVSSLGSDEFKTDEWNCDIALTSSQKALALPPGLAFISISKKTRKMIETSTLPKFYFDIKKYELNFLRNQTPFTPAISILYQLDARLKKIKNQGIENIIEKTENFAERLREGVKSLNIKLMGEKYLSNGEIGMIMPNNIDPNKIIQLMKKEYNIELAPNPPGPAEKVFRAGIIGNLTEEDITKFVTALKKILIKLDNNTISKL